MAQLLLVTEDQIVHVEDDRMDILLNETSPVELLESEQGIVLPSFELFACDLELLGREFGREGVCEVVRPLFGGLLSSVLPQILRHGDEGEPLLRQAETSLTLEVSTHPLEGRLALVASSPDPPESGHGSHGSLGQVERLSLSIDDDRIRAHDDHIVDGGRVDLVPHESTSHLGADPLALDVEDGGSCMDSLDFHERASYSFSRHLFANSI